MRRRKIAFIGAGNVAEAKKRIIHFYCYTCKDHELKTNPHYRAQKQRFARRRKAEKAKAIC